MGEAVTELLIMVIAAVVGVFCVLAFLVSVLASIEE